MGDLKCGGMKTYGKEGLKFLQLEADLYFNKYI